MDSALSPPTNRRNAIKAAVFRSLRLRRAAWLGLVSYLRAVRHERAAELRRKTLFAEAHRRLKLLRRAFSEWRLLRRKVRAKADAVRRHFLRFRFLRDALRSWRLALVREQLRSQQASQRAEAVASRSLLRRCLARWRGHVEAERLEREAGRRTSLAWSKARELLYRDGRC